MMDIGPLPQDLQEVVAFHGHLCPGLLIGYRAAKAAAEHLGLSASRDEELVAVVENNSCSVDAFQALLSTTFGKGNLIFHDHGKQVFTVIDRDHGRAVRVSFTGDQLKQEGPDGKVDREAFARALLSAPTEQVVTVERVPPEPPAEAVIEPSIICARCGEPTQASRTVKVGERVLCKPCALEEAK
jgi:formylmethanofuran dehydrogenase subunit E